MDLVRIMRWALDDFTGLSRLVTNPEKSHVFLFTNPREGGSSSRVHREREEEF
jgi:hypothetical protein